jgi:glucose-6-phosphate 1-dehydrogenase
MGTNNIILVIFGITGDLAQRKLLPALRTLTHEGHMPRTKIIGISRRQVSAHELLEQTFGDVQDTTRQSIADSLSVFTMDLANPEDYAGLRQAIEAARTEMGGAQVIFYLSVPPQASLPIVENLGKAGLNDRSYTKLLLEKPFGVDLPSAEETIATIARYYDEAQLYRIDHYLAKEMAQNIVTFRCCNAIFRNLWRSEFIERIDIIASEKIGIEGRAGFYEQTGALRDFLQNHLMQLMALTLMDIPADYKVEDLPRLRYDALRAIRSVRAGTFGSEVRRGQYAGYADEAANPGSLTETFALVTLHSDDPRWQGVPIRLATGKYFAQQTTEIRVHFKKAHQAESNLLVLHMQPREGIEINLWTKKPGYDKDIEAFDLHFDYKQQPGKSAEAYERVLLDAFASDKSLFTGADEVLESWRILQPVQQHWAMRTDDLGVYQPGSSIEDLLT